MQVPIVVFLHIQSPSWLALTHSIVEAQIERGNRVTVVDVAAFSEPSTATFTSRLPSGWVRQFRKEMELLGVRVVTLRPRWSSPSGSSDLLSGTLEEVIDSHLATWMRTPNPQKNSRLGRFLASRLRSRVHSLQEAIRGVQEIHAADRAFVPSGRSPSTRYLGEVLTKVGKIVTWTEIDRFWGGIFQEEFRIHDRNSWRQSFIRWEENCQHSEDGMALEWLEARTSLSSRHTFSKNFNDSEQTYGFTNVFFQSSPDEFMHLDEQNNHSEWESQFEAFEAVLDKVDPDGSESALRLHPILMKKSFIQVKSVYKEVTRLKAKFRNLTVFSSDSNINSYDLIRSAQRIVVSRSTLIIEASFLGKSVWQSQHYFLDGCLDVRTIFGQKDITDAYLSPWEVDRQRAVCVVEFLHSRQVKLLHREKYSSLRPLRHIPSLSSTGTLLLVLLWRREFFNALLNKP